MSAVPDLAWGLAAAVLGGAAGSALPALVARLPDRADADPPGYADVAAGPPGRVGLALVTAAVTGLLVAARAGRADAVAFGVLGVLGVALAWVDLRTRRLPDRLTAPALVSGAVLLGLAVVVPGTDPGASPGDYLRAWAGLAALGAGYLVLALLRPADMGLGDVKLAAVLGLHLGWIGWGHVVLGAFLGFLVGGLSGLALIAVRRATRRTAIPFGPFMLTGALVAVVWGEPLLDAYLGR